MRKHNSLREFLTVYLPELSREPDALATFVTGGKVVARFGGNLGWEYRYTLNLVLLNYRQSPEQLFLPLLLWLRANQVDLLMNHERGADAIGFRIDVVDQDCSDIEITLPLTEAVDVLPQVDGSYHMTIRDEPGIAGQEQIIDPAALLRQIYAPSGPAREFLVGYPDG